MYRVLANILLAAAAIAAPVASLAQATTSFDFNVPNGTLRSVLDAIAAQSRAKYEISGNELPQIQVGGVKGRMTLYQALNDILQGTGWTVASIDGTQVHLTTGDGSEILVTARRSTFKENFSAAGTRTNTSLRETPSTIDVVTADLLETQNAFTLSEAMRDIPGASFVVGNPSQINLGVDTTGGASFTDGLRNGSFDDNRPTYVMDSVEVLKGPSAVLTGTQVGGALLNYVPKRANGVAPTDLFIGGGSNGEITGGADVGGALPITRGLYYRVVGFAQHADHAANGGDDPYQYDITPMLGYRSSRTTLDLSYEHAQQRIAPTRADYLDASGNLQSYGAAFNPKEFTRTQSDRGYYNAEQELIANDALTLSLRAKGLYETGKRSAQTILPLFANFPAAGSLYSIAESYYQTEWDTSHYADLYAEFATGPLMHKVIVGGDFSLINTSNSTAVKARITPLGVAPENLAIVSSGPMTEDRQRQSGVVLQDQIDWGRLHLLAAARQSWYHERSVTPPPQAVSEVTIGKLSPSGGVVYDLTKILSLYASYSQTFTPPTADETTDSGTLLPPMLRERWEGGTKLGILNDQLNINLSGFRFTTTNNPLLDPLTGFFTLGPGQRAWGGEVSATGSLSPLLKLTTGYTYTQGTGTQADVPLYGVPHSVANLWLVESLPVGNDRLDLGIGGNYSSGLYVRSLLGAVTHGPITYPYFGREAYTLDTAIGYIRGRLRVNLTANNLLDRTNYAITGTAQQLIYAPGRTFRLVLDTKL